MTTDDQSILDEKPKAFPKRTDTLADWHRVIRKSGTSSKGATEMTPDEKTQKAIDNDRHYHVWKVEPMNEKGSRVAQRLAIQYSTLSTALTARDDIDSESCRLDVVFSVYGCALEDHSC